MELRGRAIALYGRFSPRARDRFEREIEAAGGRVARDLTRRTDVLVVGAEAAGLIDSGALAARTAAARARSLPVLGERGFAAALAGTPPSAATATVPLSTALAGGRLSREDADLLAAFDLVTVSGDRCRFGDERTFRTAAELPATGRSLAEVVRILTRARDLSPRGRHRIVLTPGGEAALQWSDGLTTLEGQGVLPLDEDGAGVDDLFEAAAVAEADGDLDEAARLYDLCARADRKDPIAPYNLGNIRLAQAAHDLAALAYQQALARDPGFGEARYNLAQALDAGGKAAAAAAELERLVAADPTHADAVFNLAQLRLRAGDVDVARSLYERYLTLDPPPDWAETARRAILYCAAGRLASP
jgi:tetratricopeptide (TPR) repeat protein